MCNKNSPAETCLPRTTEVVPAWRSPARSVTERFFKVSRPGARAGPADRRRSVDEIATGVIRRKPGRRDVLVPWAPSSFIELKTDYFLFSGNRCVDRNESTVTRRDPSSTYRLWRFGSAQQAVGSQPCVGWFSDQEKQSCESRPDVASTGLTTAYVFGRLVDDAANVHCAEVTWQSRDPFNVPVAREKKICQFSIQWSN